MTVPILHHVAHKSHPHHIVVSSSFGVFRCSLYQCTIMSVSFNAKEIEDVTTLLYS